ncbi:tetratricopeptide repeat protein [Mariniflexile sp.]|uniref:tetratricopeptide repeat protein n=1 Tax=Mariniflexile sp. TaxID=1979402 RepID=UPI004048A421
MKKPLAISVTLISLLSFGQANKLYRKAEKTTDLAEKITLLSQVISLEPKNLDAYFYRAIAKHNLGDYGGAIVDYSKIIVDEPDADTYLNRGNSRYSMEDYEGAKQDYHKAFELDKNLINAKYGLGCVKYDLGDFEGAFLDFNSIIQNSRHQQNTPFALIHIYKSFLMRALVYETLGNYVKALEDYSTVILIEPSAENYYNRGKLLINMKFYEEAHTDLTKSLALNKNNAYAYFYRGASNLFLGKFMDAISDLSKAVKFDPKDFDAYLGLAIAYNKVNDPDNARINFEKANAILSIGENIKTIEQYRETFWFQNQYFHFNKNVTKLVKLK